MFKTGFPLRQESVFAGFIISVQYEEHNPLMSASFLSLNDSEHYCINQNNILQLKAQIYS